MHYKERQKQVITAKQEVDRTKGIGSSDVPTILGLNPWQTPYDLWMFKTHKADGQAENPAMYLGTMLEDVVLKLAADKLNQRIVKPTSTFVGCHSYCRANIDGMVGKAKRGSPIVEAKTTSKGDDWGEEGSDQIPERVRAQVMFQMACCSSDLAHVATLIGDFGLKFKMFRVPWDADYGMYIMERVQAFWERNVLEDKPPAGVPSIEALKRVRRIDGAAVQIAAELFEREAEAKATLKAAEEQHETARGALMAALGQGTRAEGGAYTLKVSMVDTERFNTKQWCLDNPDTADIYRVPSSHQRVTISKKKETA